MCDEFELAKSLTSWETCKQFEYTIFLTDIACCRVIRLLKISRVSRQIFSLQRFVTYIYFAAHYHRFWTWKTFEQISKTISTAATSSTDIFATGSAWYCVGCRLQRTETSDWDFQPTTPSNWPIYPSIETSWNVRHTPSRVSTLHYLNISLSIAPIEPFCTMRQ